MAQIRIENDSTHGKIAHLPGDSGCCFETLCGNVDTGIKYTDTEGVVTCESCLKSAQVVVQALTTKEISTLRKGKK